MDSLDDSLHALFAAHVDAVYRTLDTLHGEALRAVELLADCVLGGHRIMVCGAGIGAALAQGFAVTLLNRIHVDRPGLPVITIGGEAAVIGAIAEVYGAGEALAHQVRVLGQPGDLLVLIGNSRNDAALVPAAGAARACEMRLIELSVADGHPRWPTPASVDIELRVPAAGALRAVECQQLVLDALAELLEARLFGSA